MTKQLRIFADIPETLIPKEDEGKENFMARCMTNPQMQNDFDEDQRTNQCALIWSEHREPQPSAITMFGGVGDEITAKALLNDLEMIEGDVDINLFSGGGDLFEASAIFSILQQRKDKTKVRVFVHGLAASAGAFIAVAGDELIMEEGAMLMIHNAWVMAVGNKDDLRERADLMEKQQQSMVNALAKKSGKTKDEVQALLDAETWLTAQEAVDEGFADAVFMAKEEDKIAASVDKHLAEQYEFKHIPKSVTVRGEPEPKTKPNNKTDSEMNKTILNALGIDKPVAEVSDSDVVASINHLKNEKANLEQQLTTKAELVDELKSDKNELETKVNEMQAKVKTAEVKDTVSKVLSEVGVELSDEAKAGLERRAEFYHNIEDEARAKDVYEDMKTYAEVKGVKIGKSTKIPSKPINREPAMHNNGGDDTQTSTDYEKQLQAKTEEVLTNNPSMSFFDAVDEAKRLLKASENGKVNA